MGIKPLAYWHFIDPYRLFGLEHSLINQLKAQFGYRELRQMVSEDGINSLFKNNVDVVRDAKIDRYGIRSVLSSHGGPIKFEIVSEGNIDLELNGS